MATEYTVQQGDTLLRIAKQHGFQRGSTLYEHPSNAAFRELRPDPNLIYPGDKIKIPDIEPAVQVKPTNGRHTFTLKAPELEKFYLKILNRAGEPWVGKRVILNVTNQELDVEIPDNGLLEIELPNGDETEGKLQLFMEQGVEEPSYIFDIKLAHLDPIEETSGIQARCNLLGYDAGEVNGEMNEQTRDAIKYFQAANSIEKTGEPDRETKNKLKEIYGC